VSCNVQGDGVRFCGSSNPRSTTKAFDGVPIDVNVAFPPERTGAVDGNYPLIMIFHGYGGGKLGLNAMRPFLERGFATFSMTTRGFRESCGSAASRTADPSGCERGYVRLIDNRYEVRDAQEFAAELADQDLIDGQRIGATGGSYGGGMSMVLATAGPKGARRRLPRPMDQPGRKADDDRRRGRVAKLKLRLPVLELPRGQLGEVARQLVALGDELGGRRPDHSVTIPRSPSPNCEAMSSSVVAAVASPLVVVVAAGREQRARRGRASGQREEAAPRDGVGDDAPQGARLARGSVHLWSPLVGSRGVASPLALPLRELRRRGSQGSGPTLVQRVK
jgi:Acetyl xylan esterase (AXE1)